MELSTFPISGASPIQQIKTSYRYIQTLFLKRFLYNQILKANELLDVELTEVTGKSVKKAEVNTANGEGIDVSDLTDGLYIITVHNRKNETTMSTKIMIHHE